MEYLEFLKKKQIKTEAVGFEVAKSDLNPLLFEFQKDIVRWGLKKGRAAFFEGCGLGKTAQQSDWAQKVYESHAPNSKILIVAPLAVSNQSVREGQKFNISINLAESQSDVLPGLNITNYEKLHKFEANKFCGVVLDESSILKSFTSKTRNLIIDMFSLTPYRLACTATPAPNDYMELGNHAEFLGVMTRTEMLSMFFVHDGGDTAKWRLKGHAEEKFWEWVASWAVMITKPSDLGYEDGKFILPPKSERLIIVKDKTRPDGLIHTAARTLSEQRQARKDSLEERCKACADKVNSMDGYHVVWCELNAESELLINLIDGAVEIKGSDSNDYKKQAMIDFAEGKIRVLITKPSIAGFGMNWQHCNNVHYVGLSNSFEQYYQSYSRFWRFGQENEVNIFIYASEREGAILENIKRKEEDAIKMQESMLKYMRDLNQKEVIGTVKDVMNYQTDIQKGKDWVMYLGDCVEKVSELDDNSIDYSIFSPPFSSLYTYSNFERDMGNCRTDEEFAEHFKFLIKELYRVIKPGRLLSFHCMNLPTTITRDGYIGQRDFRGLLIRMFEEEGWIYHSEVTIWKNPVVAMQRTKALGLLWKQLRKDSSMSRQGIPDFLVTMRKPGENKNPITHSKSDFPLDDWQEYASPVWDMPFKPGDLGFSEYVKFLDDYFSKALVGPWMDINQTNTLQYMSAREDNDERHICPLQLDVIERGVKMWSNEGDLILSPFAGIGSEGYQAVKMGRKFIGIELKPSYFEQAVKNLQEVEREKNQMTLWEAIDNDNES